MTTQQKNISKATMFMLSWENPASTPDIIVKDFDAFKKQLTIRLDILTLIDKVKTYETLGVYSGKPEKSAVVVIQDATIADKLTLLDAILDLGYQLGQESILLRIDNENILFECSTGKIIATGVGIDFTSEGDHTLFNDVAFALKLEPVTAIL